MGETGEWDSNVQVIVDEATVKVSKKEEGLNVFNLLRFRPFANDLDLIFSHHQAFGLQYVQ